MPKNLYYAKLFDIYADILPPKQKDLIDLYYNEDLSLSEIAENVGLTRQGVHEAIKRAEQQLTFFENNLHFAEKISELKKIAENNDTEKLLDAIKEL